MLSANPSQGPRRLANRHQTLQILQHVLKPQAMSLHPPADDHLKAYPSKAAHPWSTKYLSMRRLLRSRPNRTSPYVDCRVSEDIRKLDCRAPIMEASAPAANISTFPTSTTIDRTSFYRTDCIMDIQANSRLEGTSLPSLSINDNDSE
ncbi:hypothetical protein FMUND_14333 [Fusarium mundagurra]|uniref:Uncharacterized protein n=1 Tax=Fusarium mundagurra TaxID=1567541 RepID=A0A8H6D103_9HYPO|nr:hypothetical protein FMUND_14333 [Fusarium mundagurra]